MSGWTALVVGAVAAVVVGLATRPVLRALPEPVDDDAVGKIPYATLPTAGFVSTLTVLSGTLVGGACLLVPVGAIPQWFVLGTAGILLAGVDARTTWLPLTLTRVAWVSGLGAVAVGAVLSAVADENAVRLMFDTAVGAIASWVFFGLIWRLTRGGIAFGDVRFAPLVGAAAGSHSLSLVLWALLLGAVVGGIYGVVRWLRRRREPFPYAPSLFAGAWLALALTAWS